MWRSIAARASISKHAAAKLGSVRDHHPQALYKTLNSNPTTSHFLINELPTAFLCQSYGFSSQSSINHSEFDPDDTHPPHHESPTGSSYSQEFGTADSVPEETHAFDSWGIQELAAVIDKTEGISAAHVGSPLPVDGQVEDVNEGGSHEVNIEKLESLLSLLQSTVDGSLESTLNSMDLRLDEEFLVRVIETPAVPVQHLIRFFKWALSKDKFVATPPVLDALVRALGNDLDKKDVYALWDLIKEIGEKEKDTVTAQVLNGLISLLSRLGKAKAAFEVYNKFEEFECVHNSNTYYLTVEALCNRSFYDWAWLICQKMLITGSLPESEKIGEMILLFCKGYKAKEAFSIYCSAKENSRLPPQKAINRLISTMSKVDDDETVNSALKILDDFSSESRRHAIYAFKNVVSGLCRIKDMDGAKGLLSRMIEEGPPPGNTVFNLIINSFSKAGELDEAMKMLRLMENRGLKPDLYTYSVIMSGYSKGGLMDEACRVLCEAKKKHPKLCPATYHTLIRGYCKLKEFDKALQLLSEMEDYGVRPTVDEYNKMIQSLCLQALDWKAAEGLLDMMKQKGLHLPSITRGLVQAVKELEGEALGTGGVVSSGA
ncbi:hypothetical protein Dimus_021507 [Dionaea muscipula]